MKSLGIEKFAPKGTNGTCPICDRRPKQKGQRYCHQCGQVANKKSERAWWRDAVRYAVWRGFGIAFMPNGGDTLVPKPLPASALGKLPKGKTLNLDEYVPGLTREQVKKIKQAIRVVHNIR